MSDVPAMAELITYHAERGRMLHRSRAYLYERVRNFSVCQMDEAIVGCCALEPVWGDLAEIKSLAVGDGFQGRGIGKALLRNAVAAAKALGVQRIFCLTRETGFFESQGFMKVNRETLPHKVWSDCVNCPISDSCDEIAMLLEVNKL